MVVTAFFQTSLRNIEKTKFISLAQFLISFGNIGFYGYCGTAEL